MYQNFRDELHNKIRYHLQILRIAFNFISNCKRVTSQYCHESRSLLFIFRLAHEFESFEHLYKWCKLLKPLIRIRLKRFQRFANRSSRSVILITTRHTILSSIYVGPHYGHAAFGVWTWINFWTQPTENGLQIFCQELSIEVNINISR